MSKNYWGFAFAIATFFLFQIVIYQHYKIELLSSEIKIVERSKQIEQDQSRELMYHLNNLKTENESIGIKQFVAGVTLAMKDPDVQKIWHEGYDRGVEVKSFEKDLNNINETYTKYKTPVDK